jgi:RHS repeat-associated protein
VVWHCDLDQEMQRETLPGLAQFLVERRVVGGLAEKRGPSHRLMEDGVDKADIRTSRPPRHIAPFNSSTERPPRKPNPTPLPLYGRIVEQQWLNTATGTAADDIKYSYDRDGNVLSRDNLAFSNDNETYSYNGLNQLISFTRGTETQSWSLDAAGNWSSFTTNGTTQTRTSNLQNQITTISGATTPTYDYNGNTLTDDNGTQYTYDAWNRMVKAVTTGGSTEIDAYDALGRRITVTLNSLPTDYYYSSSGQVLEEIQYLTGGENITENLWSPVYVNALFERIIGGTPYAVQQDADWNVTTVTKSVINPNTYQYYQQVQEGFVYDPYGKTGTPYLNMPYLFQGGRSDSTTGLYELGARDYSPTLGRWMEQDPIRYGGGDRNLYGFLRENPVNSTDQAGLQEFGGGYAPAGGYGAIGGYGAMGGNAVIAVYPGFVAPPSLFQQFLAEMRKYNVPPKITKQILDTMEGTPFPWTAVGKPCMVWAETANRKLPPKNPRDQLLDSSGNVIAPPRGVRILIWAWTFEPRLDNLWTIFADGHFAIRVIFPDGKSFFFDDGEWGGMFGPERVPPYAK